MLAGMVDNPLSSARFGELTPYDHRATQHTLERTLWQMMQRKLVNTVPQQRLKPIVRACRGVHAHENGSADLHFEPVILPKGAGSLMSSCEDGDEEIDLFAEYGDSRLDGHVLTAGNWSPRANDMGNTSEG